MRPSLGLLHSPTYPQPGSPLSAVPRALPHKCPLHDLCHRACFPVNSSGHRLQCVTHGAGWQGDVVGPCIPSRGHGPGRKTDLITASGITPVLPTKPPSEACLPQKTSPSHPRPRPGLAQASWLLPPLTLWLTF